ncbi:hypothetical protein [Scytonema sp. HK-05]|uniref:hypothetical protein n=1 Tax=Scytonema sp. HK-05 TaxID=1137095 RepID=UPI000936C8F3|nr:hypothetical protein [Scytonema sp. HK-05]OKH54644.1 hypothetical protein NIES2130_28155 [Scytonema sp. HK-05]
MAAQTAGKSNSAPSRVLSSLTFSTWLSIAPLPLPLISIARIFYKLWTTGEDYTDPGMDYYEQRYRF